MADLYDRRKSLKTVRREIEKTGNAISGKRQRVIHEKLHQQSRIDYF